MSQWIRVDEGILVNLKHVASVDSVENVVYLREVGGKTWTMTEESEQAAEDFLGQLENL